MPELTQRGKEKKSCRTFAETTSLLGRRRRACGGYLQDRLDCAAASSRGGNEPRTQISAYVGSWARGKRQTLAFNPGRGGEGEVTLMKLVAYENGVMPFGSGVTSDFINLFFFSSSFTAPARMALILPPSSCFSLGFLFSQSLCVSGSVLNPHLVTAAHCKILLDSSKTT